MSMRRCLIGERSCLHAYPRIRSFSLTRVLRLRDEPSNCSNYREQLSQCSHNGPFSNPEVLGGTRRLSQQTSLSPIETISKSMTLSTKMGTLRLSKYIKYLKQLIRKTLYFCLFLG